MRILDLFSGIGGFALGMEMAGFPPPVAFCEIEPFCRQVLAKHWPEVPCHEDVTKLSADAVRPIDIICGGFPCQDISCAGKGLGIEYGERSGLWREMFRIISELMPRWVLAENVPALRTRGADRVIADLETLGYTVWPIVVGAWAVGAPHKRDRVWIVAYSQSQRRQAEGCGRIGPEQRLDIPGAGMAHRDQERRQERGIHAEPGRDLPDASWRDGSSSDTVAHTVENGRGPWTGTAGDEGCQGQRRDCVAGCRDVAISGSERREEPGRKHTGEVSAATTSPWPAGRGAEQHEWEAPRILRFERGLGAAIDGIPERLVRRMNRNKLRAAGNAVVPQVVAAIARRILEIDARLKP